MPEKKEEIQVNKTNAARFEVQFELPVDDPFNKVGISRGKRSITFFVPINYPDAHKLGYADLLAAAERSGLIRVVHRS